MVDHYHTQAHPKPVQKFWLHNFTKWEHNDKEGCISYRLDKRNRCSEVYKPQRCCQVEEDVKRDPRVLERH